MSGHGGPTHSLVELPEVTGPTVDPAKRSLRAREWRDHFDPAERARRLHDYLTRRAANGEGDHPLPLELRKVA